MPPVRQEGLTPKQVFVRGSLILALSACVAGLVHSFGYTNPQTLACTVFAMTVLATLFFWEFRLAVAFLGIAALFACNVLTLERFVDSCELPVILFLVGMMVTVGVAALTLIPTRDTTSRVPRTSRVTIVVAEPVSFERSFLHFIEYPPFRHVAHQAHQKA